jgi:ATP-dependent helicase HrpA
MHRRFTIEEAARSDFLAFVRLWDHLRQRQQELTGNQFRRMCRAEYLNYLRVREWQDLFSQLRQIAGQLGIRAGTDHGHPDRIHQALLAGLLSHLGMRDGTDPKSREFRGAHGSKFAIGAGSALAKAQPKWVIAAELVETNRLWARTVASVQPEWAERIGGHLVKYSYGEPRWDARSGRAIIGERATLYGLPIVTNRTIGLDRVDPGEARVMFLRHALVERDWASEHPFLVANAEFLRDLRAREERSRTRNVVDDDAVLAFYDQRVGPDVVSGRHFDQWWRDARRTDAALLTMTAEALGRAIDNDAHHYPSEWVQGDLTFAVSYRFEPGADDDGVTVHLPLAVLNRVSKDGFDWQVPGFREELVMALAQTLPKDIRRQLIPMGETVTAALRLLSRDDRRLVEALAEAVVAAAPTPVRIAGHHFDVQRVQPHLRITFAVHDAADRVVAIGKDLNDLKRRLRGSMRTEIARVVPIEERSGITSWDVGDLLQRIDTDRNGVTVHGYPALVDDGDAVSLRVLTSAGLQARVMRGGVRRLLLLTAPVARRTVEAGLGNADRLRLARSAAGGFDDVLVDCVEAVADRLVVAAGDVFTGAQFDALVARARGTMAAEAIEAIRSVSKIVARAARCEERLAVLISDSVAANVADVRRHLHRLVRPRMASAHGAHRLADVARYVEGIERRLEKITEQPAKDLHKLADVLRLERAYGALLDRTPAGEVTPAMIDFGWNLEELRVSIFAPALGVARSVSTQRLTALLNSL